jgi:hypothetical protein
MLDDIVSWVHNPEGLRLCWLSGGAGTGKSSVANSISEVFYKISRLGASFRFNRDKDRLNSPDYFFGNIAYQLAYFDKRLRNEILVNLQSHGNVQSLPLQNQAQRLIVDTTAGADLVGPLVIVVDALDESGDVDVRAPLLHALCMMIQSLPPYIKVIITSRDEQDIRVALGDIGTERSINDVAGTSDDIFAFIQAEMETLRKRQRHLGIGWPGLVVERKLTQLASGLFIWASVACKVISEDDAEVQLSALFEHAETSGTSMDKLDRLYLHIIQQAFGTKNPSSLGAFGYVVGSIIMVKDPLSEEGLDVLLGLGRHLLKHPLPLPNGLSIRLTSSGVIISSLRSLLRLDGGPVRILHPSVFDFFTSPHRCTDSRFRIDKATCNQFLALRCLSIMNDMLKMDICGIGSYTLLNSDIDNLGDRMKRCVPEALRYACPFFTKHIGDALGLGDAISEELGRFFSLHVLHWVEVMSLLGEISRAEDSIAELLVLPMVCVATCRHSHLTDIRAILDYSRIQSGLTY